MEGLLGSCQTRTVLATYPLFVVGLLEGGQMWSFDVASLTED